VLRRVRSFVVVVVVVVVVIVVEVVLVVGDDRQFTRMFNTP